jgi:hypothetical protein
VRASVRAGSWLLALALAEGCGAGAQPAPAPVDLIGLLPPPAELAGWTIADGPVEYVPDTLYEYLDGGAERYRTYGFVRLVHARYRLGDDPIACVTVDVYDMADELGAFGIFSAGRPPGVEKRPWGAGGYRTGTVAVAYRGRVFVHGEADDDRPQLLAMLEGLVARVSDAAPGEIAPPTALSPLPVSDRVPGSERYVAADLLGYGFLPGGVLAIFEVDERRSELFYSDLGSGAAAGDAVAAMRDHLARMGTLDDGVMAFGDGGFRFTNRNLGAGTVVHAGRFVAGIQGQLPVDDREPILDRLVANLNTTVASSQP